MTAAGPFGIGDRVRVPSRGLEGEVVGVGAGQRIQIYDMGKPGEIRTVVPYEVRLDNGQEVNVVDRDGHILPA